MKKLLVLLTSLTLLILFLVYQQEILNKFSSLIGISRTRTHVHAIASISDLNRSVTLKRANDTIWNTADTNEELAMLDAVSTGYDSTATIRFNLGYIMSLGERSLIVIEDPKQEAANLIEINLDQGTVQAKNTTADNATLKINSNNAITEVSGRSDFTISVNKASKRAEIWIRVGRAKIKDRKTGEEIIVKENEKKTFSTEAVKKEALPEPVPVPEAVAPPPPPEEEPAPVKIVKKTPAKKARTLRTNDVAKIVAKQRKKIDTCYEKNKRGAGGGGKKVSIKFVVAPNGIVTRANIARSDLGDAAIERCVVFWIKAVRFPKFDGKPIEQTVNFVFQ